MQGLMMNYPLTLTRILERARRLFHDQEIVTKTPDGVHRYTYADLYARCCRLANALHALGAGDASRIGSFAWNTSRHLELYFGVPGIGAALHTINVRLSAEEIAYIVNHAKDELIFVDESLIPILEPLYDALPTVKGYVVMGDGPLPDTKLAPLYRYEDLLASASPDYRWPELDENQACGICYTSGTTGRPKGVVYSHRAFYLLAMVFGTADCMGLRERDVALPLASMFHAGAWGLPYAATMFGAKQVYPGRDLSPENLARLIEHERVSATASVPTIWMMLLPYLREHRTDLSSLRIAMLGGAPVPAPLIRAYEELGVNIVSVWGMTEVTVLGTACPLRAHMAELPDDERLKIRSKPGYAVPDIELRAVDEAGNEVPWDAQTPGELQVRGPRVIGSYLDDPERSTVSFQDGWLRTGDVGAIDPHGYVEIVDRAKDLVKSGGEWISSIDLENAIMAHPAVLEASVFAVSHEKWQERPVAAVVLRPGVTATEADILDVLRPKFAKWWLPDAVLFVDAVPKTSVGKFDKKVLRERYKGLLTSSVTSGVRE